MQDSFRLENKKILIIGCKNWARKITDSLSKKVKVFKIGEINECDFRINFDDENNWDEIRNKLADKNMKFDALVHIGEIAKLDGLMTIPAEKWGEAVSKNLRLIYQSVNTFSDFIKPNGSIVIILEIGSMEGLGGGNIYEAFEKESRILLRGLASSLSDKSIRINALRLGYIETEETIGAGAKLREVYKKNAEKETPLKRIGSLKDVENAIVYLVSDASQFITGAELYVDGGIHIKS